MTTDENGYPIVRLSGSDLWERGYEYGQTLSEAFPGQDASQLASAMVYNDHGPLTDTNGITDLVLVEEGQRDGDHWVWQVSMEDGTDWIADGWCDYTGWDCQSGLRWEPTVLTKVR